MNWIRSVLASTAAISAFACSWTAAARPGEDWPMFGRDLQNTSSALPGSGVDPRALKPKWVFTTGGDVSARAAVVDGVVYFPDKGGNLWALDARSGSKVWGHQLSDYFPGAAAGSIYSRTSPAVDHGVVYIGTQQGAYLMAIDAATGALRWKTQLQSSDPQQGDPYAIVTSSPAVFGGRVYAGVASSQEVVASDPNYPCCNARGSVVAVNVRDGSIAWKTYTVPVGYNGGGVWGSHLVVDPARHSIFAGTGNNYSTAPSYAACIQAGGDPATCNPPDNHADSILALDLGTGAIKWATREMVWNQPAIVDDTDDWNLACIVGFDPGQGDCPVDEGPDYDFSSAPNLITYQAGGRSKTILGAGQKSGIYYALDPDTGTELWRTQVGPGSDLGGIQWGSATDGKRIYVAIANYFGIPWDATHAAGLWAALDPATGRVLWRAADPNGSVDWGPVTVADSVVYVSSMAPDAGAPTMLALDAASGRTLWSFAAGSSVNAGATIVDGMVYWGSGYALEPPFTGNDKFYAFSRDGR